MIQTENERESDIERERERERERVTERAREREREKERDRKSDRKNFFFFKPFPSQSSSSFDFHYLIYSSQFFSFSSILSAGKYGPGRVANTPADEQDLFGQSATADGIVRTGAGTDRGE